jgi:hypothetical protein
VRTEEKRREEKRERERERERGALRGPLVMWLWMRFTRSHRYYRLVKEKTRFMLVGFTKNMVVPQVLQKHNFTASRGGGITEQWSHAPLSHCSLK